MNSYLTHVDSTEGAEPWQYDFALLSLAATMIFGVFLVLPLGAYGALKYLGKEAHPSLVDLVCLYGYSSVALIPACLLCIIPVTWVQWLSVMVAFAISASVLVRNLLTVEGIFVMKTDLVPSMVWLLCHFGFALSLKLLFFQGALIEID